MLLTSRSTARRAGSLVASLGVLLAMFLVASPAQAAVGVDLQVNHTTITQGDSVTLTWTSGEAVGDLAATGDWSGPKNNPGGNQVVTPTTTGDHTYTLTATDSSGGTSADSVTVTVEPITPNPVTFPDPCTVVIPTTPHVTYFVDFNDGSEPEELDADTYDGGQLSFGDEVGFFAHAESGFALNNNAVTTWNYTAPDSCFDDEGPIDEGPDYVTTTVDCGSVTFTNTTDAEVGVLYGSADKPQPDGGFTLAAGASRTIKTKNAHFAFLALLNGSDEGTPEQFRFFDVPQNCDGGSGDGNGSDHPTTAPAAGITAR
jgi:hypothetical protein